MAKFLTLTSQSQTLCFLLGTNIYLDILCISQILYFKTANNYQRRIPESVLASTLAKVYSTQVVLASSQIQQLALLVLSITASMTIVLHLLISLEQGLNYLIGITQPIILLASSLKLISSKPLNGKFLLSNLLNQLYYLASAFLLRLHPSIH